MDEKLGKRAIVMLDGIGEEMSIHGTLDRAAVDTITDFIVSIAEANTTGIPGGMVCAECDSDIIVDTTDDRVIFRCSKCGKLIAAFEEMPSVTYMRNNSVVKLRTKYKD